MTTPLPADRMADILVSQKDPKPDVEEQCPVCCKPFLLADLPIHADSCINESASPSTAHCPICNEKFALALLDDHANTCASTASFAATADAECPICQVRYPVDLIEEHVGICMGDEELEEEAERANAHGSDSEAKSDHDDDPDSARDDKDLIAGRIPFTPLLYTPPAHSLSSSAISSARLRIERDDSAAGWSSTAASDVTAKGRHAYVSEATTSTVSSSITIPGDRYPLRSRAGHVLAASVALAASTTPTAVPAARSSRKRKVAAIESSPHDGPSASSSSTAITTTVPPPALSAKAKGKRPRTTADSSPAICLVCHKRCRVASHAKDYQAKSEDSALTQLELDELLAIELTRPLMATASNGDQILTPAQLAALTHVYNCARRDSLVARTALLDQFGSILKKPQATASHVHGRARGRGMPNIHSYANIQPLPAHLDAITVYKATTEWIRNRAPIIVHVQLDSLLRHMATDTHYRNYFEVAEKGDISDQRYGHGRKTWETRMFGGAYDKVNSIERPKYGVLNPVADPQGIRSCLCYGDSYMVLRGHTRYRATFAAMDSASDGKLATCEFYNHILLSYSQPELHAVALVALGVLPSHSSAGFFPQYKELQIHGPLEFARDVERLVVHERYRSLGMGETRQVMSRYGATSDIDGERFWGWMREFQDRCPNVDVVWMDTGVGIWVDQL